MEEQERDREQDVEDQGPEETQEATEEDAAQDTPLGQESRREEEARPDFFEDSEPDEDGKDTEGQ